MDGTGSGWQSSSSQSLLSLDKYELRWKSGGTITWKFATTKKTFYGLLTVCVIHTIDRASRDGLPHFLASSQVYQHHSYPISE